MCFSYFDSISNERSLAIQDFVRAAFLLRIRTFLFRCANSGFKNQYKEVSGPKAFVKTNT